MNQAANADRPRVAQHIENCTRCADKVIKLEILISLQALTDALNPEFVEGHPSGLS
ncbi:MAG: hypothetical protein SGI77_17620 [Pirellulaceae bacterium]|nr:hypothetical protein [Pirellulaceae bacterium]